MSPIHIIKKGLFGGDRGTIFESQTKTVEMGGVDKKAEVKGTENGGSVTITEDTLGTSEVLGNFTLGDGHFVETHGHRFEGCSNESWNSKFIPPGVNLKDLHEVRRFRPVTKREEDAWIKARTEACLRSIQERK